MSGLDDRERSDWMSTERDETSRLVVGTLLLLLLNEPVLDNGGGGSGIGTLLAFDLDGHVLVLLQAGGKVGFLRGLGGLGEVEGSNLADSIGLLDGGRLVRLELLEVELLDEVG